jgi:alkylhydroperoxidase family enzyme
MFPYAVLPLHGHERCGSGRHATCDDGPSLFAPRGGAPAVAVIRREEPTVPRLVPVSPADAPPELAAVWKEMFAGREPTNFWTTFALVPDIHQFRNELHRAVRAPHRSLDTQLIEIAIARAGLMSGSRFEYSQHLKGARRAGVAEEKLQALKGWTTSDLFDARERAVLAYTDEFVLHGDIQDQTFAALQRHLDDVQIFELTMAIAAYHSLARVIRALGLEFDDVPDRFLEVPRQV